MAQILLPDVLQAGPDMEGAAANNASRCFGA